MVILPSRSTRTVHESTHRSDSQTMSHAGTSTADSLIGTTLAGRYRIEARVGSGAMGAVYRAEQTGLGRRVALKIVNRGRQVDYDTIQRFRREATALSALHHPNTVRVFDFGTTPAGLFYLAMELLEGEPLTARMLRERPLPLHVALSVTQQVLRSIGEAHARGIVHRDLKPDNIFLARVPSEPAPIVKVLDFGIAKAVAGAGTINQFETLDGTVFGTPRYMSPEQAGGRVLDARSDLYSVGIMLYELLAGNPPFVDGDAVVVMARHIRDKPVPLIRAVPTRGIPASLDAVVSRALAKTPAERFQTSDEFERALERCKSEISGQAPVPFASLRNNKHRLVWPAVVTAALGAACATWVYARGLPFQSPSAVESGIANLTNSARLASTTNATNAANRAGRPDSVDPSDARDLSRQIARLRSLALPSLAAPSELPELPQLDGRGHADPSSADATSDASSDASSDAIGATSIVSVQTAPPAAAVLQDGSELGVTPLEVSMSKGSTLTLLLKKKGFAAHRLELRSEDRTRVVTLRRLGEHAFGNEKAPSREKNAMPGAFGPSDPSDVSGGTTGPTANGGQAPHAARGAATNRPKPAAPAATTQSSSPSSSADQRSPYERF